MEIRRFFVAKSDISGNAVYIRGDEFVHMTKVLRYKVGYRAVVCANDGAEHLCTVREISKDFALLQIDQSRIADKKSVEITLYAGLLKNNKLDFVIQKATELGIDMIIPFTSANCAETKFSSERANRIALEAAKQCGSAYLTAVGELCDFETVVKSLCAYDDVLIAYEGEKRSRIADSKPIGKRIALIVGPEGGFKEEEVEHIVSTGGRSVTLGRRILRAETASIVLSALLLDSIGELDND